MNFKILIFFIVLFPFQCGKTPEIKTGEIYQCVIFQWSKNFEGNDTRKVIAIDKEGRVICENKVVAKLNKYSLAKSFSNLIEREKLVKIEADNNPPPMSTIPENGKKVVSVNLTNVNDIANEEKFANKSHYLWKKVYDVSFRDIDLYKYLSDEDSKIISDILE
ncbi:hypothetical protein [Flavobacterium subsaxonicum]|uniref:Uncharacterized protein n=1 Tax=Flavobacterium subsaxonicum WB 4.1-42 = DSM 21790 TaxID=1121898 RepID=A0A0A2MK68_9FLAO|nr:hypothetical protein [Flavobacterium subsaxonicum]KGO91996.1 hypothetical protein Q766_15250 [Flavobacterium subsaxonicum WB 4.1-42 = DSM 21790]